ncbi:HAD-IC family P-type ATPase, partial [Candidatus Parcubacteria bacterium]|nr:HAD-IC family P-type ATPase [Candidatus Parcubacteria bacterium]
EIVGDKKEILKCAILSVDAFVENPQDPKEKWKIQGRPLERAILKKGIEEGIEKPVLEKLKVKEYPFDSVKKFSGAIFKENGKTKIALCGAPEKLLEICQLNEKEKESWEEIFKQFGKKGERIVGVCKKEIEKEKELKEVLKEKNFNFLGIISFHDPLRPSAKEAIQICKKAKIEPMIVSGDNKYTTEAIAKELGIESNFILEGKDLNEMPQQELENVLPKVKIFARAEPKHKLKIARFWQRKGKIVAMTGDGVNDAPALRGADIGVSLGSGTEVAKEASDLILLNDDFSILKDAILEGRRVLDNARKSILFMCAECFSEIILVFGAFLLGYPLPVLPIQILWKNMIEGSPQGLAFAFEPEEKGIIERGPEDPKIPILTKEIKYLILFVGVLTDIILLLIFIWLFPKIHLAKLQTLCYAGLAFGSFCYAFSCKAMRKNIWEYNPFSNKVLNLTLLFGFLLLLATIYLPPFQFILKTEPLGIFEWKILLAFGILNLIIFEIVKWFLKRKNEI